MYLSLTPVKFEFLNISPTNLVLYIWAPKQHGWSRNSKKYLDKDVIGKDGRKVSIDAQIGRGEFIGTIVA